jgi:hypothetical protein
MEFNRVSDNAMRHDTMTKFAGEPIGIDATVVRVDRSSIYRTVTSPLKALDMEHPSSSSFGNASISITESSTADAQLNPIVQLALSSSSTTMDDDMAAVMAEAQALLTTTKAAPSTDDVSSCEDGVPRRSVMPTEAELHFRCHDVWIPRFDMPQRRDESTVDDQQRRHERAAHVNKLVQQQHEACQRGDAILPFTHAPWEVTAAITIDDEQRTQHSAAQRPFRDGFQLVSPFPCPQTATRHPLAQSDSSRETRASAVLTAESTNSIVAA